MSGAASSGRVWRVLKFGGTSVSTEPNWRSIAATIRDRGADGSPVLVVHSALSGITDRLERLLAACVAGRQIEELESLRARHLELAAALGLGAVPAFDRQFALLEACANGIAARRQADARDRAAVMAFGELLATTLGVAYLATQGIEAAWLDARTVLRAESREGATRESGYLSATCDFRPDSAVQSRLAALGRVVLTQGFIASDAAGDTVLLGRGGSDTSGAYFAALLAARELEIWTDVPGMFSANPRSTPAARQLRSLSYDEAQEIATAGAKVLHPRCLLPVRQHGIPLAVYATQAPQLGGTHISETPAGKGAQVKAVCVKNGVTLVAMDSPGMWHQVGFLADAFAVFKRHGLSVDLVSTSETNVTVSLDPQANALGDDVLDALQRDLAPLCRTKVIGPCASVSLVGRNIRGILPRLGDALGVFAEQNIHLVSQAANDLNLTFVVDESQGARLVADLHEMLIAPVADDAVLGPTWQSLMRTAVPGAGAGSGEGAARGEPLPWWRQRRETLLSLMRDRDAAYVYDTATIGARCRELRGLRAVSRLHYAMKANPHPAVLAAVHAAGVGIECVSRAEVEHALASLPGLAANEILFTPNFAPRDEYRWALDAGVRLTLDNLHPLRQWAGLFRGREAFLRLDPGAGRGHHAHVRTGGTASKFGIPSGDLAEAARLAREAGLRVTGLHVHAGSGIGDAGHWAAVAEFLLGAAEHFPDARVFDLGGGLGVPDRSGRAALDLAALDAALLALAPRLGGRELWLEPGRYLVAEAGVLLARVTQLKDKGASAFVGVATGMNSLIRPALYGAHHDIFNLTRLDDGGERREFEVVGPICETGDVLGHGRLLPAATCEGDVLLVATAGAYGAAMASHYNLRSPAPEIAL
ncbi:MAG: bifunctional aspartate kinase/diaminopimelate decarboxylase [Gammaproteobacteria bacterium]|nr:bifunctional aspartate kinase/diaminopimelate decarboxylase [Gammaproteobacteria bacterium]